MGNKAIFITVRTDSKRLPHKALLEINNKKVIEYVIENAKKSKKSDLIILCTTNLSEDNILCEISNKHNIKYYCGSVNDKLDRWLGAVNKYNIDFFCTMDGDDLFCESLFVDMAFEQYEKNNSDRFIVQCFWIVCSR